MFWTYNATSPQIDIILCKEELTLYELLDQENILQELKTQNLKLIEFLLKPEILGELVDLITSEPPLTVDETEQYKYPNLACELLTSDLPALNERLVSGEILDKLYNFLKKEPPLNPLLSSYFSRTLSILISRKSEQNWYSYQYTCLQALEFLKAKDEFIELLLKHMGTSSIMDLMHNLVTLVEGPTLKETLRSWLQNQNVIPNIVGLLNSQSDVDIQVNAASVLCSIIQKLRENISELNGEPESDPILNLLESSKTIELLLNTVFNSETLCETTIEGGIDVLLTIMQPYLPGQMLNYTVHDKTECNLSQNYICESEEVLADIVNAILPFIKKLRDILQNPIKTEPIKLTSGVISPPFGKARLLVAKLIAVLISLNNQEINDEIIRCDIPELLLDLFDAYSSNNFLHAEVEKLVAYAIDGMSQIALDQPSDHFFLTHLLTKCELIQRILKMWNDNEISEKNGHYRKGHMGYVIRIATLIHILNTKNAAFDVFLSEKISSDDLEQWNTFVENTLLEIIDKHTTCLGGVRPKMGQSNENSFVENFPSKELKSTYKDYDTDDDQNVIFSDDPSLIAYGEEGYSTEAYRLVEEQAQRQAAVFNEVCSQKWKSMNKGLDVLDDADDEEEDRIYLWNSSSKSDGMCLWCDSDDENLDSSSLNSSDPWSKLGNAANPWANTSNNSTDDTNWANFDENFGEPQKLNNDEKLESCSTLATNVEQYSLFGNSSADKSVNILSNFSNVKISNDNQFEENCSSKMLNGEWNSMPMEGKENENGIQSFGDQDSYRDMVDLEYISGNTLAEKLANAENDIRNEDELMREQALRDSYMLDVEVDQNNEESTVCNVEASENEEDISDLNQEQNCSNVRNKLMENDCLTENSVDYVTAENSISDAESSTEFGDAENSLEIDDITCDRNELDADLPNQDSLSDDFNGEKSICTGNVPTGDENSENSRAVDESKDGKSEDSELTSSAEYDVPLVNGEVTESEKNSVSCDNSSKDASEKRGFNREQVQNVGGVIINELA